jgi:hypothetical protein
MLRMSALQAPWRHVRGRTPTVVVTSEATSRLMGRWQGRGLCRGCQNGVSTMWAQDRAYDQVDDVSEPVAVRVDCKVLATMITTFHGSP